MGRWGSGMRLMYGMPPRPAASAREADNELMRKVERAMKHETRAELYDELVKMARDRAGSAFAAGDDKGAEALRAFAIDLAQLQVTERATLTKAQQKRAPAHPSHPDLPPNQPTPAKQKT